MIEDAHPLTVTESPGRVRVQLGRISRGEGPSLQEAGDDLIHRLLGLVIAFRSHGSSVVRVSA